MAFKVKRKTFWKSVSWYAGAIFFGQIQLWLVWVKSKGNLLTADDLTYNKILMDGYILFFCTGVTTSLGLDYWFNNSYFKRNDSILYFIAPFIILLASIVIGSLIIGQDTQHANMPFIRLCHTFLIISTTFYIVTIKLKEFSKI